MLIAVNAVCDRDGLTTAYAWHAASGYMRLQVFIWRAPALHFVYTVNYILQESGHHLTGFWSDHRAFQAG